MKRDEEGNPVRDDDGKLIVLLDPEAVGRTELTIKQEPNGAYTGTTFEYDVTVKPVSPAPARWDRSRPASPGRWWGSGQ